MSRGNKITLAVISTLFAIALLVVFPADKGVIGKRGIQLGLDLVGGVHLVYQADLAESQDQAGDMARALETIRFRIDEYGVTEPIIQKQGEDRILVQLPGFTNIEEAKGLVERTGFLEFREVERDADGNPIYLTQYLTADADGFMDGEEGGSRIFVDNEGATIAILTTDDQGGLVYIDKGGNPLTSADLTAAMEAIVEGFTPYSPALLSWMPARSEEGTQLTGDYLDEAVPYFVTGSGLPQTGVGIRWDKEGTEIFDDIAGRLYQGPNYISPTQNLGIFLDNSLISHPWIKQPSYGGEGAITGQFSADEVTELAILLQSGALPMPLEKPPLYQEKVSATLGADFINMSITAGLIGIVLVMVFMGAYYRAPGGLACAALAFYVAFVLAIFKLVPVTLSLAGIGGFVLSIGMAVDANILIFERMKEELRMGRTLEAAVDAGFSRAWPAIRDSNITTFIICGILYGLGSNIAASAPVMGFALTLAIGVGISMFTAIVVTRTFLRIFATSRWAKNETLFRAFPRKDK